MGEWFPSDQENRVTTEIEGVGLDAFDHAVAGVG